MSTPWRPEREVTLAEARAAVAGLVGEEAAADVREVAAGWDNTVLRAGPDLLFRFPRRAVALAGIEREVAHLPRLAPLLPLAVPVPEHVGTWGDPPWPFWGGRHLPGAELATAGVVDEEAVAHALGSFLRVLHAVPVDPALPLDPFARADARGRARRARPVLAGLAEAGLWSPDPRTDALLAAAEAAGPCRAEPVTSHGDLYSRHVLVDAAGRPTAVIDWGDVCAAPRCVDLAFAFSAVEPGLRPTFFAAYGPVDGDVLLRARTMALFSTASVAAYALDVGDEPLLHDAARRLPLVAAGG